MTFGILLLELQYPPLSRDIVFSKFDDVTVVREADEDGDKLGEHAGKCVGKCVGAYVGVAVGIPEGFRDFEGWGE